MFAGCIELLTSNGYEAALADRLVDTLGVRFINRQLQSIINAVAHVIHRTNFVFVVTGSVIIQIRYIPVVFLAGADSGFRFFLYLAVEIQAVQIIATGGDIRKERVVNTGLLDVGLAAQYAVKSGEIPVVRTAVEYSAVLANGLLRFGYLNMINGVASSLYDIQTVFTQRLTVESNIIVAAKNESGVFDLHRQHVLYRQAIQNVLSLIYFLQTGERTCFAGADAHPGVGGVRTDRCYRVADGIYGMSCQGQTNYRVATEPVGIRGRVVFPFGRVGVAFPSKRFAGFDHGYCIYRIRLQYLQGQYDKRVATVDCLQLTLVRALRAEFLAGDGNEFSFADRLM